jgi:hypothetical protein
MEQPLMHNYVPKNTGNLTKVTVYNPNPYPVTITSEGHMLGGRESAKVVLMDKVVSTAIKNGFVIKIEDSESAVEQAAPVSSKRKKKS